MRYLVILLLLASCGTENCPVPKKWTPQEQQQIAAEHNALPPDSILRGVLDEWESTRRALR